MLILYTIISVVYILISILLYNRIINPISTYLGVWYLAFFLHECGLAEFDAITSKTLSFILLAHTCVLIGCAMGKICSKYKIRFLNVADRSEEERLKRVHHVLIATATISIISLFPVIISSIRTYGLNILKNTANIYFDSISSKTESNFSLSSVIFVNAAFLGYYLKEKEVDFAAKMSIFSLLMYSVSTGSRGGLIILVLLVISAYFANPIGKKYELSKKDKKKILIFSATFLVIIVATTMLRNQMDTTSAGEAMMQGTTGGLSSLVRSVTIYLGAGIGCLDKYLQKPIVVDYPQFFFRVPYIILNRLGITNVETTYRGFTYAIPFPANVITYIGELYHDFQFLMFFVIMVLSFLYSMCYCHAIKSRTYYSRIWFSALFTIYNLSFFSYFGRVASIWIVIVVGSIIALLVDKEIKVICKGGRKNR